MARDDFRVLEPPPPNAERLVHWLRKLWEIVNSLRDGKINATGTVTLTANAAATTVTDYRVTAESYIGLEATTDNAARERAGTLAGSNGLYISNRTKHQFTIGHTNHASEDRTFIYVVLG